MAHASEEHATTNNPTRMKITEALLAVHAVFHTLFDHLEQTTPRLRTLAEVRTLGRLLDAVMESHSHTEDGLMIEPLEHCFEQIGQRETFHHEHDTIERNLRHLQNVRDLRQARKLLLDAVATARKHFDKEERIVFPLAEKVLKGQTLNALGKTWMERRKVASS
jgi:hemerythrin-like domain-containing protein